MEEAQNPYNLSKRAQETFKSMSEELDEGKSPQQILGYSDEIMSQFYKTAYQLFEEKKFGKAADAFLFLASLNSHHHEYWLGLGMATQMCHEYEQAIDAYELAALCDISSPVPYFYLAKCLFAIHDRTSALDALNLAIETAGENSEYDELKRQAEKAKEVLNQ